MKSAREKIIVSVAALVVIFGLFDFMSTKNASHVVSYNSEGHQERMQELMKEFQLKLSKDDQSKFDDYIIVKAQKQWGNDPFLKISIQSEKEILKKKKMEEKALEPMPRYSGYLIVGEKFFAVIDGIEYEAGNMLKMPEGFVVKEITPAHVLIENENGKKVFIMIEKMPGSV